MLLLLLLLLLLLHENACQLVTIDCLRKVYQLHPPVAHGVRSRCVCSVVPLPRLIARCISSVRPSVRLTRSNL